MYKVVRKFNQNNDNYNTRSQSPDKNNRAARRKAAAKARKATTVRKDRWTTILCLRRLFPEGRGLGPPTQSDFRLTKQSFEIDPTISCEIDPQDRRADLSP